MSHIVHIETQVRDGQAVRDACCRLELPEPVDGETKLFSGTVSGLAVQLPAWRYPIVCDLPSGRIHYDHFGGRWGDPTQLQKFLQMYAVVKAHREARRQGHTVTEQPLADGSIKLTVHVGRTV